MRVLHFLPAYAPAWQFGGPILSVSRLCEGLVQQGVDVRVMTTNAGLPEFPTEQLGTLLNVNGVQVTYFPVDGDGDTIFSRALIRSLPDQMQWAELLHLSSIWQPLGVPVQNAAHAAGVPVIQTLRGALGPYSWRRAWWKKVPYFFLKERPLLQKVATLHCTTSQEAKEINWLRLKPRVSILPNPLDLSKLFVAPVLGHQWRKSMGISSNSTVFLIVGRIHHKKGLDLLPEVFSTLRDSNWDVIFIGQDDDGSGRNLKLALRKAGLQDRCHWLESVPSDDLLLPYNGADFLLLPSRHENFGNVVAEALACGCGVVVSDKVGISELLIHNKYAYVVPRSPTQWSSLLKRLINERSPLKDSQPYIGLSKEDVAKDCIQMYESTLCP